MPVFWMFCTWSYCSPHILLSIDANIIISIAPPSTIITATIVKIVIFVIVT